jgi:hypothetical protein
MGYSLESANALIDRFENHHQVIKYNQETRGVALLNWGKYNLNRGGKPVEDCMRKELKEVKDKNLIHLVAQKVGNDRLKSLYLAQFNDTSHDTSTTRTTTSGQKEKEKELPDKPKGVRPKQNLSSPEEVKAFVEKQLLSNPLPVDRDLLIKFIDCLRLTRKNGRVSASKITTEWEKWSKYPQSVITYAMWSHTEKHDDKREEYTLGIMRNTKEHEASRKLMVITNKQEATKNATNNNVYGGHPSEIGKNESTSEGTGYYDQFDGLFAN